LAVLLHASPVPAAGKNGKRAQGSARGVEVEQFLYLPIRSQEKTAPMDDRSRAESARRAAENGSAPAQFNLGLMYRKGRGVHQDDSKAVQWYEKAAAQGHGMATVNLGFMLENGSGTPKDGRRAIELYKKAAMQGVAVAQFNLGVHYAKAEVIPKDCIRAYAWLRLAADNGYADAERDLELIGNQLTPSQTEEARKLSEDLPRKNKR
jgi:TPR repeat protein